MLLWLKGAPLFNPGDKSTWQKVCDFVDDIISVSESTLTKDLIDLQKHKHTRTCKKRFNSDTCRFGIPYHPMDKTRILAPLDERFTDEDKKMLLEIHEKIKKVQSSDNVENLTFEEFLHKCDTSLNTYLLAIRATLKTHKIFLRRDPSQININAFIPKILRRMRSNMDAQFILDPYGVACYVVDYINKTDRGMSDTMDRAWREIRDGNYSLRDGFRKIVNTFYNTSEISVQEACYNILQLHLSECSEDCIYIPTSAPAERVRIVKAQKELAELDPQSRDIFIANLLTHYANRPLIYDHLCLAEFAANYQFTYKSGPSTTPMRRGKGFLHKRTKPRVIRYRNFSFETDPDDYFREHLLLYKPWNSEKRDIMKHDFETLFHENHSTITANKKAFHALDDTVIRRAYEDAAGQFEMREGLPETDNHKPDFDFNEYHLDTEDQFVDVHNEATGDSDDVFHLFKSPGMIKNDEYQQQFELLNEDQRDYINSVAHEFKTGTNKPMYHLVTGGAGVGKSLLISVLYQTLIRVFNRDINADPDKPTVLLCAPTGLAAFNIKGQTIHSSLKLPVNQKRLQTLSANVSNTMATVYSRLKLVIIDEISMVGQNTFAMISKRLQDLFDPDKPFGGLSVICVGDFFQTRAVCARSIYHPNMTDPYQDIFGENIWERFKVFKLTKIMRQNQMEFQTALNNLAVGKLTQSDTQLFNSRTFPSVPHGLDSAVHLFARNDDVDAWNEKAIKNLPGETYTSTASDNIAGQGSETAKRQMLYTLANCNTRECMGIPEKIDLKEGAKYMVTYNMCTQDGLTNGATGKLMKIDHGTNHEGKKKPLRLWILFNDPTVGQNLRHKNRNINKILNYPENWTPIEPVVVRIRTRKNSSLHINRMQFALTPAHALTVHKSQGQTLPQVVVHLNKPMRRDLLYVACSRATSAEGLFIIGKFTPPNPIHENDYLFQEMKRWETHKMTPIFRFLREDYDGIQVLFHNIQSIPKHWNLVRNDKVFTRSHILMFGETWTKPNDNYRIPHFNLVERIDCQERRTAKGVHLYANEVVMKHITRSGRKTFSSANRFIQICWTSLRDIIFISLYASPNTKWSDFEALFIYLSHIPFPHTVIMGDFNFNSRDNKKSHKLLNLCKRYGLSLQNKYHSTTQNGTSLDWVLSNFDLKCGTYTSFFSYHDPIWIRIPSRKSRINISQTKTIFYRHISLTIFVHHFSR